MIEVKHNEGFEEIGFYCGRFQHFHGGHESIVRRGLMFIDKIIILIGSAQDCGTVRNPFRYETRKKVIEAIFAKEIAEGRIEIYPLNDLSKEPEKIENINSNWGKYVLGHMKSITGGRLPDIMLYGNDEARSSWFAKEDIRDIGEFIAPRSKIQISATQMRELIISNQKQEWMKYANPNIYPMFDELKEELLQIDYYKNNLLNFELMI